MSQKNVLEQVNALQSATEIALWLAKFYRDVKEKKLSGQSTNNEERTLMSICVSENYTVGLHACRVLIKAAEEDILSTAQVQTVLLSLLANAEGNRFSVISGALCEVTVTEFRKQCKATQSEYTCPYGLQNPEHPFIAILNANKGHGEEIAITVKELFNHQDKDASSEFLRPVFLYVVKNIEIIPSARTLWLLLIQWSVKSDHGSCLFMDCLMWISCQNSTLFTNILLNDALEAMVPKEKPNNTLEILLKMLSSLPNQLKLGLDPRMSFTLVLRAIQSDLIAKTLPYELILQICLDILDDVPHFYIGDLLTVIRYLVFNCPIKSFLIHRMMLDSLNLWSVAEAIMSDHVKQDIKIIREHIEKQNVIENKDWNLLKISFVDRMVGLYEDLDKIRYDLDDLFRTEDWDQLLKLLESLLGIKVPTITRLVCKMIRGMLLSHDVVPLEILVKVTPLLSNILRVNEDIASKFLTTIQYEIERINDSLSQLNLLRVVIECGHHRSNVPSILTLLRNFSEKNRNFEGDILKLYLRLWQIDTHTYQYLYDQLSQGHGKFNREFNLDRVEVIKIICEKSPTQHGVDLVAHLSEVLNQSSKPTDDGADICVAIDTIIMLCKSHTVSIVDIWKTHGFAFSKEKRPKVIMSLCKFLGEFPKYANASSEYNNMTQEIYQILWTYALTSKFPEVQKEAFAALEMFPLHKVTLKEIPEQLRENLKLAKLAKLEHDVDPMETLTYIPGECWLQLLMKVNNASKGFAGDLIAAQIRMEIQEYHEISYNMPDGRKEPRDLSYLPPKSILQPIIQFVHQQAAIPNPKESNNFNLIHCMRILSQKFPKPIPPVNWSCLYEVFIRTRGIRQYCVPVAISQSAISQTAKQFLCNYLENFKPSFTNNNCDEDEEIWAVVNKLPTLLNFIDPLLVREYIKKCFKGKIYFCTRRELLKAKIKEIVDDLTEDHLTHLAESLKECYEIQLYSDLEDPFLAIFSPFKKKHLAFWIDFASRQPESLKKDIHWLLTIDFKDIKMLDPIIKHISDPTSGYDASIQWKNYEEDYEITKMELVFKVFKNNPEECLNWCLKLLADMQYAAEHEINYDFENFLMILEFVIDITSGYEVIYGEIYGYHVDGYHDAFPQSLMVLSEMEGLKDQCSQ
uniref:DUF3730 domain-containing protein n=2 Tax=Lutzomyia longipalpis TaxID=7200 RepID=A0A1B0GJP2_LUTLO